MRVFVVGATGVLGRALVPLLLARGHAVRALVRSPERGRQLAEAGADVVPGDLLEPELAARLPDLVAGCQAVIHAATAIPRDPAAPGAWDATTRLRTEGTRRLLDAALAAGARRYLQQSIVMAYPEGGDRRLDEATPLDDSPARAAVCAPVAAMEGMVRAADPERLGWCILRGGIFVGPGTGQDKLIARARVGWSCRATAATTCRPSTSRTWPPRSRPRSTRRPRARRSTWWTSRSATATTSTGSPTCTARRARRATPVGRALPPIAAPIAPRARRWAGSRPMASGPRRSQVGRSQVAGRSPRHPLLRVWHRATPTSRETCDLRPADLPTCDLRRFPRSHAVSVP
jgi:uncharacterized protein YbjT (DUF2867 family)